MKSPVPDSASIADPCVWIERLALQPHPEGGYFRRIYTDPVVTAQGSKSRPRLSSIHYLLTAACPLGVMHRNRSTILHYLQHGGPVEYLTLSEQGVLQRQLLGYEPDQALFLQVPGGCWKASRLQPGVPHALVSEVVVPGFDPEDHDFLSQDDLRRLYPHHVEALQEFVRQEAGSDPFA
ncbi:cupin domain-containing protein [Sinimarinibacterium sp. CAU 1509]|uniref:cupin domain-containing protein n=1 Tax=Sinimarinibacterium sp. CAU 1509 TaxID=2562283 RepID=UPI0010ACFB41|nr:cupin domain-containing protein [Sinimarinibacterium sp. CAU 1509]TJY64968.1 cupin domain-containing protein [Sinimarinibacterium sp. CAU 1509]